MVQLPPLSLKELFGIGFKKNKILKSHMPTAHNTVDYCLFLNITATSGLY